MRLIQNSGDHGKVATWTSELGSGKEVTAGVILKRGNNADNDMGTGVQKNLKSLAANTGTPPTELLTKFYKHHATRNLVTKRIPP